MKYNADERMRNSLDNDIKMGFLNSALGYMGNYKWYDRYFGVEGKGMFMKREEREQAESVAWEAIRIWRATILS